MAFGRPFQPLGYLASTDKNETNTERAGKTERNGAQAPIISHLGFILPQEISVM